jgi:hypothetical protein
LYGNGTGAVGTSDVVYGPAGYNNTKDNATTLNIYWDAGNTRWSIQNLRASSIGARILLLGTINGF